MWRMKQRRQKRDHPLVVTKRQDGGWNFASEPEVKSSLYTRSPWCMHWMMDGFMDGWIDGWIDWWIGSHWVFLGICWKFPRLFSATTGEKNAEQWCHRISVSRRKKRQTHRCGSTESIKYAQFMNWVAANLFFQFLLDTFSPFLERIWWSRDGRVRSQLLAYINIREGRASSTWKSDANHKRC